jgi:RNA-dependent RNA polymerase
MPQIGKLFLLWLKKDDNFIRINLKKLKFFRAKTKPLLGLMMTLDKTPYLDPDVEEERQKNIQALGVRYCVDKIQIGMFYRPSPGAGRNFSVEWEASFSSKSLCWLSWEYDHKLLRVCIGDKMTEQTGSSIVIRFSNIRKLGIGCDFGNPCMFGLSTSDATGILLIGDVRSML